MDNKIIVVAGPTASGKTSLGIEIAKAVNGEIISADSMQVYKGMSIACACPTQQEKSQVRHHLVEFLDRGENFSVAVWCKLARQKIEEITGRGNVPIIVGGTGLFIDSLVDNIIFSDTDIDFELREKLMKRDNQSLYDELLSVDYESGANIHINNKKRIVRALELYYSGVSKSTQNINSRREKSPYNVLYFVLNYEDRQVLYDRINRRVDQMVIDGLEQEARENSADMSSTSSQAIGHKELKAYFDGEISFDEAIENLKRKTRNYAKRQITWFKKREGAIFITPDLQGIEKAVNTAKDFINE